MSLANQKIFSILSELVSVNNIPIRGAKEIRYIKSNQREKKIIKHLTIKTRERLDRSIEFAIGIFENKKYLLVVGPRSIEDSVQDTFDFVSMDAGWFTTIISEMEVEIAPNVNAYEVADILNDRYLNASNPYEGHFFSEISQFFIPFSVFSISPKSPIIEYDLPRIAGIFLCAKKQLLNLDIPQDILNDYDKLFNEGPHNLPFEELLDSITSLRWKDAFLNLYRCIELLFLYYYIQSLQTKAQTKKPLNELIEIAEDVLGWKVKEDLAIDAILSSCGATEDSLFRYVKKRIIGDEKGGLGSELIYKLRNSIVHHRQRDLQIYKKLQTNDWVLLMRGLLIVILNEYKKYFNAI